MDPKRSHSLRSAAIIAGNDDLLTEIILLHLPARSLMRFKSVSKHWQSLISEPRFAVAHTNHHSRRRRRKTLPSFILGTAAKSPEFFYFNPTTRVFLPHDFEQYTRILQSSHGLLLLECRNSLCARLKHHRVYNPATRQSRKVEFDEYDPRRDDESLHYNYRLLLSFDPSKSPYYKIICTRRTNIGSKLWIEIYHSEFDRWEYDTSGGEIYRTPSNPRFLNGISCSNGIYWIRIHRSSTSYYFDIETRQLEVLSRVKVPRRRLGLKTCDFNTNYIMESNGQALCVSAYFSPTFEYLFLYELSDHITGWVEKYRVDSNPFSEIKGLHVRLLGIVRGDGEEDSSVLLQVPGKIVCYWFFDKRFEVLCNFSRSKIYKHDELQFQTNSCFQFVESLAPV